MSDTTKSCNIVYIQKSSALKFTTGLGHKNMIYFCIVHSNRVMKLNRRFNQNMAHIRIDSNELWCLLMYANI